MNVPRCPRCGGMKRPVVAAVDICYCEDDFDADELGLDPEEDYD